MKNWGIQKFLNPVGHNDDGYFKFSIRFKKKTKRPDIYCKIADCSGAIYLEFGPELNDYGTPQDRLVDIKERKKKINLFADAIEDFRSHAIKAFDEYEESLVEQQNL